MNTVQDEQITSEGMVVDWRRVDIFSLLAFIISGSSAIYIAWQAREAQSAAWPVPFGLIASLPLGVVAGWLWWHSPVKG